jgi:hypothetical protein
VDSTSYHLAVHVDKDPLDRQYRRSSPFQLERVDVPTWAEVKNALNEKATEPQTTRTRRRDGQNNVKKRTAEDH